ncbi:peptidoglycan bridge formation protein FemAB [Carbonactinospora thermoautotrophica]|uniref:Methicillin resistance protein n=1 Tax=Carbonactinospora thermoautotrophica TaxID=1469144 RepID=A0A132NB66_9ACTN|nr:peptidoglycan bridge formation glycyltransferase FemA/FemB family protein [Carbonactinospora thermoautotrophica]KWW97842.1 peptidoglycan bridge formation protein FemAB [Carbonactinospora thermoautotrophica]KWW98415.1 Methicillin resistance protein [Carbonactinospora thermoautotrophica]KWX07411.1 peptidoglycan bridge formation protein FemAB [Carbonactinospora thermoautotrophica]
MSLRLRPLSREEHLAFIKSRPSVSFLQCPSWADVKTEWSSESIGWVDSAGNVVGAGLVLFRQVPKMKRYLAYLPEGPVIDWERGDVRDWLDPMIEHLKKRGAFAVKMGPPIVTRKWEADTIKKAIRDKSAKRLRDVPADYTNPRALEVAGQLRAMGWLQDDTDDTGFGDVQPRYVFQVPLAGRSIEEIHADMNQLWRRNIKKAMKAGVEVVLGDYEDIPAFHELYVVTAKRDGFTPRPLGYFQRMWKAMKAEDPNRIRLYFAEHEDDVLAAATMVTVGNHVWYSYGASANHKREVRPSNAMQWKMLRDAYSLGASVYDLRGISSTLDENDKLFGLIQFKVGTGGQAVEYLGEWDYPINKLMYKAFELYMSRR